MCSSTTLTSLLAAWSVSLLLREEKTHVSAQQGMGKSMGPMSSRVEQTAARGFGLGADSPSLVDTTLPAPEGTQQPEAEQSPQRETEM